MAKTNYADVANVSLLLTGLADDITETLLNYSLVSSDNWANSLLSHPESYTGTPALVQQACEYYAASFILRNLYDVSEGDSGTAIWYEETALKLLKAYIGSIADEESEAHPYSGSLSPSKAYETRDLRTVYDPLYGQHDNIRDEWDSEG